MPPPIASTSATSAGPTAAPVAPAATAAPVATAAAARPSASTSASGSARSSAPSLPLYSAPSSIGSAASSDSFSPGPRGVTSADEIVTYPPRGTLAAGKIEVKTSTIWIVVALGALILLAWALFRMRRVRAARLKQSQLISSLKKGPRATPSM